MDLGQIFILLGIIVFLFIITHLRPLNEREIQKLSDKRRNREINRYFTFNKSEYNVNKEFKKKMKPTGKYYHISTDLLEFPSIAAGLLKYKKHEWIIIAFEKDKKIDLVWLNKGEDNSSVTCELSSETIAKIGKDNNYSSILTFHNHPNSDPNYYDCSNASQQDMRTGQYRSQILNKNGLNLISFVCERGRHFQYYFSTSMSFLPINGFISTIMQKNGQSRLQNLLLHIERLF